MARDTERVRVVATLCRGIRELDRLERNYLLAMKQGVSLPEWVHEFFAGAERPAAHR